MKDILMKLRILLYFIFDGMKMWKKEVWQRNLNEHFCCNGDMCGCQGISVREEWEYNLKRK